MNGATKTLAGALGLGMVLAFTACQTGSNAPAAGGSASVSATAPTTATAGAPSGTPSDSAAASPSQSGGSAGADTPGGSAGSPSTLQPGEVDAPQVKATGDAAKAVPRSVPRTYRKAQEAENKGVTEFLAGVATSGKPSKRSQGDQKQAAKAAETVFDANAAGSALKELQSEYVNNAINGRTVTGVPVVKGPLRTVDLKGGLSRVFVCLDSSAVEVRVGKAIENPAVAPGTRTAVHIYDLRKKGDQYVVERHSFTSDPSC